MFLMVIRRSMRLKVIKKERELKMEKKTKCLAIVSAGIGNIIEAVPMLIALDTLFDVVEIGCGSSWDGLAKILPWKCITDPVIDELDYDVYVGSYWSRMDKSLRYLHQKGRKVVFSRLNVVENSEVESNMDVARQLGYVGLTPKPVLKNIGTSLIDDDYIVIASGYQKATNHVDWKNKAWPHWEKFVAILKDEGYKTATVGVENECEEWHKDLIDYDLCGKTDIKTLAATLRNAKAVVACDNGPAHIADAYGVPTVALFGPGSTVKNVYFQARIMFMPFDIVPCRPCHPNLAQMSGCKDNLCMKLIEPQQVAMVLKHELQERNNANVPSAV